MKKHEHDDKCGHMPMKKKDKKKAPKHDKKHKHHEKKAIKNAMKHKDVLGAGAKKRKHLGKKDKVEVVMKEFKRGTLNSGSGAKVKNRKQAIAIALSEARKSKKK